MDAALLDDLAARFSADVETGERCHGAQMAVYRRGRRVLDVGAGTGVLALAALRFGAGRAVAFDLDPLAAEATRSNAALNGLADRRIITTKPTNGVNKFVDRGLSRHCHRRISQVLDGRFDLVFGLA